MATGRVPSDSGDLRACREVLRHLDHPQRLRDNPVACQIVESGGQNADRISDAFFIALLKGAIASALTGYRHADWRSCADAILAESVTLTLPAPSGFPSGMHFASACALRHISARLIRTLPVAQARVESALDPLFFRVAHAQAIEHNGNWRAAADILERLRSDLPDASSRSFVETRLVRLFVGAERFSLAEHHLHRARTFVTQIRQEPQLAPC